MPPEDGIGIGEGLTILTGPIAAKVGGSFLSSELLGCTLYRSPHLKGLQEDYWIEESQEPSKGPQHRATTQAVSYTTYSRIERYIRPTPLLPGGTVSTWEKCPSLYNSYRRPISA